MKTRAKIELHAGAYSKLAATLSALDICKPMFVVDGAVEKFIDSPTLGTPQHWIEYNACAAEPTTTDVDSLCEYISIHPDIDGIVAIGGGSTMDLGKAVAVTARNGGCSERLQGWNLVDRAGLPCVVVPTISGTGAEVSGTAVLKSAKRKLGINSEYIYPTAAVIDPLLTRSVAPKDGVPTFMDCYIHAVEIKVGRVSSLPAVQLADIIVRDYEETLLRDFDPADSKWSSRAALCSYLGGLSLSSGVVGACHAISYGLSNTFGTRHGIANLMAFQFLSGIYGEPVEKALRYCEDTGVKIPNLAVPECEVETAKSKFLATSLGLEKLWVNVAPNGEWQAYAQEVSLDVWERLLKQRNCLLIGGAGYDAVKPEALTPCR